MDYRRVWQPGGTYFFTINLLQRKGNDLLVRHINVLRHTVQDVKARHPFKIHAWVVCRNISNVSLSYRQMMPITQPA